jgi:hypothetical protein
MWEATVAGISRTAAASHAGQYLRELLRAEPYCFRWLRHESTRERDVHQISVAKVLAGHLREYPRETRDLDATHDQLTHIVSRALKSHGTVLTRETLQLFISAFGIRAEDAAALWSLWRGDEPARVVIGTLPPPDAVPGFRIPEYDVLKLQDHHWLGRDGTPVRHRTEITIRSRVPGLAVYQHRFDTPHARVRVVRGGTATELAVVGGGIWGVDVRFPQPLGRRDVHYLEIWTLLGYDEPPPAELRRGTHERIEHLDMRVAFHRDRLPKEISWGEWGHYDGPDNQIVDREVVALDAERAAHRYVQAVERAVVGFTWEW